MQDQKQAEQTEKTALQKIRERLREDYDTGKNEEEFLMHYVEVNLLDVCREIREAIDTGAWEDCKWAGTFLRNIGANFDLVELQRAGDAVITCAENRDRDKLSLVHKKLARIAEAIVNETPTGPDVSIPQR